MTGRGSLGRFEPVAKDWVVPSLIK
jgi:hypothetical protein